MEKNINFLSKSLSFLVICFLISSIIIWTNSNDMEVMESMTDSEKVEYLTKANIHSIVEMMLYAIITGLIIVGMNRLLVYGFKGLFNSLKEIRRVQ